MLNWPPWRRVPRQRGDLPSKIKNSESNILFFLHPKSKFASGAVLVMRQISPMSTNPKSKIQNPKLLSSGIKNVTFGDGCTVIEPVNLYGCEIGAGTFIGPFVEIQKDVRIGVRCKVQSHAFICELVDIGDDCFISHGAMFVNDLFQIGGPACGNRDLWKSTRIGNHVSIGTHATILPVSICDHVVVGAGSVVTRDITEPGIYAGNPARFLRPVENGEGIGERIQD
jgi:acetyltransferase-like isoleucine patch superfamily enzyme